MSEHPVSEWVMPDVFRRVLSVIQRAYGTPKERQQDHECFARIINAYQIKHDAVYRLSCGLEKIIKSDFEHTILDTWEETLAEIKRLHEIATRAISCEVAK